MRGKGIKSVAAENLLAVNSLLNAQQNMNSKPRMCWSCQKSKSTKDGHLRIVPGLMKFICADCMAAKKEKNA